jgi:hypothetical protein
MTLPVLLVMALAPAGPAPSCDFAPGWKQEGPARTFEGENLYEYMNGNSEGYLIYGFQVMRGITCVKGGTKLIIDFSEMPDAEAAFGLWAANRDVRLPVETIGAIGQVTPRKAFFTKDRYFVEVAAESDSAELGAVARALEKQVPGTATLPAAMNWFPPEGLDAASIRLVPQSVLGMRILKRGWLVQYGKTKAFVITEATPAAAAATVGKLKERLGEGAAIEGGYVFEDKYLGKIAIVQKGKYLAGTAGADGVSLASGIARRLP